MGILGIVKVLGSGTLSPSERDVPLPRFMGVSTRTRKPKCYLPSLLPSTQPPHPVNHYPQSSQSVNTSATSFPTKTPSPHPLTLRNSLTTPPFPVATLPSLSANHFYIPSACPKHMTHILCSFHTNRAIYAVTVQGLYHLSHTLLSLPKSVLLCPHFAYHQTLSYIHQSHPPTSHQLRQLHLSLDSNEPFKILPSL